MKLTLEQLKRMAPLEVYMMCDCALCKKIMEIKASFGLWAGQGWADPRRGYSETEEAFLKRVPDGFVKFPEDHIG